MTNNLFKFEIKDWNTWGKVYCSIVEFTPLIKQIFKIEKLEYKSPKNCKPGTNGVFKVGKYIVKIFVPIESGYDSLPDYKAELFALERANKLSVSVPRLVTKGELQDKYLFRYLIMEFVEGETLGDIKNTLSKEQKIAIGKSLRKIVDMWATPCENFNEINVLERTLHSQRWTEASSDIKDEQKKYIIQLKGQPLVYVHGDLTEDNLIVNSSGELTVIDFADSLCAPAIYEEMTIICDAFHFDKYFLKGYYGDIPTDYLVEICKNAILCHEFGFHVVKNIFGTVNSIHDLRVGIRNKLLF